MASPSGFSGTVPSVLEEDGAQEHGSAPADFAVVGAIGEQLSSPVSVMQQVVHEFTQTRKITSLQMRQLYDSIESARKVALQAQQIARMGSGQVRQAPETVSLDALLNSALSERARTFQQRKIELFPSIKKVQVIVDPALVANLVEASLDWISRYAQRLVISLEMKNWPENGILRLKALKAPANPGEKQPSGDDANNLDWHLLFLTAKAMGISIERVNAPSESVLILEFPRTVRQVQGLTATEIDGGESIFGENESKAVAGHHILLISADEGLKSDVKMICRAMNLRMDSVPTSSQAARFCELDRPDLIIVEESLKDNPYDRLQNQLTAVLPSFPFVEISSGGNTFAMSNWMNENVTIISRSDVHSRLRQVLTSELAKVL